MRIAQLSDVGWHQEGSCALLGHSHLTSHEARRQAQEKPHHAAEHNEGGVYGVGHAGAVICKHLAQAWCGHYAMLLCVSSRWHNPIYGLCLFTAISPLPLYNSPVTLLPRVIRLSQTLGQRRDNCQFVNQVAVAKNCQQASGTCDSQHIPLYTCSSVTRWLSRHVASQAETGFTGAMVRGVTGNWVDLSGAATQ